MGDKWKEGMNGVGKPKGTEVKQGRKTMHEESG